MRRTLPFPGDGEMAERSRKFDWSTTSLGDVDGWSPSLRSSVQTVIESPFAMCIMAGAERILIYNDAYRSVLGAKNESALGSPAAQVWSDRWHALEPRLQGIRTSNQHPVESNVEFQISREGMAADNGFFINSFSPIRNEDGSIAATLIVAVETTKQILLEQELISSRREARQAEELLLSVFAQTPAFLAILRGEDHRYEYVNNEYIRLVGRNDLLSLTVGEAFPELRAQGYVALLDEVYQSGKSVQRRETPVVIANSDSGNVQNLFLDVTFQPLKGGSGETDGIIVFGLDVTSPVAARLEIETLLNESKAALLEAERSESRYRFLAESIPVHVWTATADGMLDFVSERTASYLGFSPDRLLREGWMDALHPEDSDRATRQWIASVQSGADYEIEFRLWSAEHIGYRWHLVRATPQRDSEGMILHWFGSNTDIHERKALESELKNLTRQAQEANRSKSDFLSAMSHELRTPLNAIGGYAQLLELGVRGPITEEQKVDLRRIQRSKTHLDGLVSGVLDFAKMGSGEIEIRSGAIHVMTLLGSVVDMVRPQLAERGLTLAPWDVPETLEVIGDEDRVRQILLNIVANAVKFTPEGGVISFAVSSDSGNVVISVTDTGIGIAEEELERMFEPFVQAKSPLHVAGVGVGLGLAISMQLARAMDGDIKVSSTPGNGSTFAVHLKKSR